METRQCSKVIRYEESIMDDYQKAEKTLNEDAGNTGITVGRAHPRAQLMKRCRHGNRYA